MPGLHSHIASSDYSMPHVNLAHVEEFACLVYIVTSLHLHFFASQLICRVRWLKPPVDLIPTVMAAGGPLLQLPTARAEWWNIQNPSQWEVFNHPHRSPCITGRAHFLRHITSSDFPSAECLRPPEKKEKLDCLCDASEGDNDVPIHPKKFQFPFLYPSPSRVRARAMLISPHAFNIRVRCLSR